MSRPWMSDGDIVMMYRQAASPPKEINVLAELNGVTRDVIVEILERNGIILKHYEDALKLEKTKKKEGKKKMRGPEWTSDEVRYMLDKKKLGLTAEQIAAELGRTKGAIASKLKKLREEGKEIAEEVAREESAKKIPASASDVAGKLVRIADMFAAIVREIGQPEFAAVEVTEHGVCLKSSIGNMDICLQEKERTKCGWVTGTS